MTAAVQAQPSLSGHLSSPTVLHLCLPLGLRASWTGSVTPGSEHTGQCGRGWGPSTLPDPSRASLPPLLALEACCVGPCVLHCHQRCPATHPLNPWPGSHVPRTFPAHIGSASYKILASKWTMEASMAAISCFCLRLYLYILGDLRCGVLASARCAVTMVTTGPGRSAVDLLRPAGLGCRVSWGQHGHIRAPGPGAARLACGSSARPNVAGRLRAQDLGRNPG